MVVYQHGGDIYSQSYRHDFSANINPKGTPESVIHAAQQAVLLSENYPDSSYRELAAAIAKKEQVKQSQIVCGNGAAELIFSLVRAVNPKNALLIAPGFAEYQEALSTVDCKIHYYELSEEMGYTCQSDYLSYLTDDLDLIFLCNPNNPTGLLIEPELICQILDECKKKEIYVCLDSCFIDFLEEEEKYDFTGKICDYPNLFILKAFTKIYAMAGLRLGYGISANEKLLDRLRRMVQPWSVSIPAQAAGVAALKETEFVKETKELVQREKEWLYEQLSALVDKVYEGKANFLFFRSEEFLAEKCQEKGILIRDCSNYRGLKKGYYRVAVRTRQENEALIQVLREILA